MSSEANYGGICLFSETFTFSQPWRYPTFVISRTWPTDSRPG